MAPMDEVVETVPAAGVHSNSQLSPRRFRALHGPLVQELSLCRRRGEGGQVYCTPPKAERVMIICTTDSVGGERIGCTSIIQRSAILSGCEEQILGISIA